MKSSPLILIFILVLIFPLFVFSQITQQVDIEISARVKVTPLGPPPPPGVFVPPPPGKIILKGMTSPFANLTVFKSGTVCATFQASSSGLFEKEITGILVGTYNFGIFAEDTEGRKTVTSNFTVPVFSERITTVSGIFLSPTIGISSTKIIKGETLKIFGQVFPQSRVEIFIFPENIVKESMPSTDGKWIFELDTNVLKEGEYQVQAKAISTDGYQSLFSQSISFLVLAPPEVICKGADLNFDGKVDLIDFSILLYFWEQKNPKNFCADINQDGIVDLIDFSIMMYYWTG
ncbi:hypothetical protein AMJ49_03505 [Parcubacteria bacterium DG_74_2]|nr:MAG: hypothetical protein AMJ49_03505 [Parcubacteria bacterium DG_74_2]